MTGSFGTPEILTPVANGIYNVNITFRDHAEEEARKVTRLANVGGLINAALAATADVTHAGIVRMSASSRATIDMGVAEPNITMNGLYTLVNQRLILGFQRAHPLNTSKIIIASYGIPAPQNAVVTATNPKKPLMTRGITYANAGGLDEILGSLVDYLETALTYEDITGQVTVGGWTYSEARSGLVTTNGIIDGDIRT